MAEYYALTQPPERVKPSKVKRCGRFTSKVTSGYRLWTFLTADSRDKFVRKYKAEIGTSMSIDTRGD